MQSQNVLDYPAPLAASPTGAEVLEQLSQGVWVADTKGRIRYTNPALNRMFGYAPGELEGQHLVRLLAADKNGSLGKFRELAEAIQTRGGWRGDCLNVRKDGSVFACFTRIHTRELVNESQWIGVQEEGSAAQFLKQFSSPYVAVALRDLQHSFDDIFGWARLIRAGQLNAQQAAEVLEAIERGTRSQQQLLGNLLELAQLVTEVAPPEPLDLEPVRNSPLSALANSRGRASGPLQWKRAASL